MLFAIISEDVENSLEKRMSVRPAHIERLKQLQSEARLILAGPHPAIESNEPGDAGFTGSLVVAEFPSLVDAQAWADADP
ncbi:MAG: YciI family protein, partial [Gammaproteobacteria bacterium]|nr:YciI family protein [Gammaproteobacteria bacterium]